MLRSSLTLTILLCCGVTAQAAGSLPSLAALETHVAHAPAAQLAEREYLAERDSIAAERTALGVSAFGTIGAAHNHDIIDPSHSYTYDQGLLGAGLQLPLLGSRLRIQSGIQTDQVQLEQLAAQVALTRRDLIGRLRKAYGAYWQNAQIEQLARGYLALQVPTDRDLALRTGAGITLDVVRMSIAAGFVSARRDAAAASAGRRAALTTLQDITGVDLAADHGRAAPLSGRCLGVAATEHHWRVQDPRLRALRKVIALRRSDPRTRGAYPVQSNLQLSVQGQDQVTTGQHGASAALLWWVQIPLGYRSERHELAAAARERLAAAQLAYRVSKQTLSSRRNALIEQLKVLQAARDLARQQLAVADEMLRERELRAQKLGGDALIEVFEAKQARYSAAVALVNAEAALFEWYGDWARFNPASCVAEPTSDALGSDISARAQPTSLSPTPGPGRVRAASRGVFLWQSAQWLREAAAGDAESHFAALHAAGITELRISLDARQMEGALADPAMLREAVAHTRAAGFTVQLLLGDPSWILGPQRATLLRILRGLRTVPFDGVSLDLEPGQLGQPSAALAKLLASLERTLKAAAAASAWPLDLDIRPSDLTVTVHGVEFATLLQQLGVRTTLMVYLANPQRVIAISKPLLMRFPRLKFHVALSLERSLPSGQSLRPYSAQQRQRRVDLIETGLATENFSGLVFQLADAWRDVGILPVPRD